MALKILMAASEAVPFAKEGGLADVVGALPKYLAARGHDIRVVMPRYYRIDLERYDLRPLPGVLVVPMGIIGKIYCGVYEGKLPGSEVPVYFLEHDGFFGRAGGLYEQENESYLDNDNRFIFLSRASLELCKMLDFRPDLVHAHDWHTAAIPLFLNTIYRHDHYVGQAASLLTIHNMQHQGSFYEGAMDVLGVGWEHFTFLGLEKDNQVNLLKGGIYHATLLNTVSEGYAREMQTPLFGWGLEGVVRERAADLYGILNGVDYAEWNPESDHYLPANYSAAELAGKELCKKGLQQAMGLPERDVPLIGMVSRLVKQKGIDLLAAAIPRILSLDLQCVLLGAGEPWAHFYFGDLQAAHSERFRCYIGYSEPLAHQIEAGADFFLMPSAFEPCGLNQMYSLRYGTLPIVRATGGLDDSVENFDEAQQSGTGFKFSALTPGALFDTVGWAVHTWYNNREAMRKLIHNAMAQRFTWEQAAQKYEELYCRAIQKRHGKIIE